MEQLKRLFYFFRNLNPGNITFKKKEAEGNKQTIGFTSKYEKMVLSKAYMFLNQTCHNRKIHYIIRLTNLLQMF